MSEQENRARLLLTWATLLACVAMTILLIDLNIKKQILGCANRAKKDKTNSRIPPFFSTDMDSLGNDASAKKNGD